MIAEELKLVIKTEAEKAVRDLKKYQDNATKAKGSTSDLQKKFASFAKGMLAAGGIILAFRAISKAVKDMVAAYGIQETAETKLRAAIKATGREASISADALYDYASELQGMTTYGDEATISAMAMLQQLGELNEEGLKKTIPLVQDFAAAMGVDLETAASLVGKTLGSSTNALSRYGLEVDMSGTKQEKLTNLTDAMRKKFGGMAKELAQTGTGSLKQYNNALGDLKEMGGEVILEYLQPAIKEMTSLMVSTLQAWDAQRKLNKAFKGQATTLQDAKDAFQESQLRLNQLNKELKLAEKRAQNANVINLKMGGTLRDNTGKLKELIEKEEEANAMLYQQMKAMAAEEKIRAAVVVVTESQIEAQDDLNESLKNSVKDLQEWISQQTQIVAGFKTMTMAQIGLNGVWGIYMDQLPDVTEAIDEMADAQNNLNIALENQISISEALSVAAAEAYLIELESQEALLEKRKEQVAFMTGPFVDAYSEAFGALGEALVEGGNAWNAFREAFKESIAGLLDAMGKKLVIMALEALIPLPALFNPAGAALAAAGAAASFTAAGAVRALAQGGDFIVPPGYPNDTYPMQVESGERVTVTPAAEVSQMPKMIIVRIGSHDFAGFIESEIDNRHILLNSGSMK